MAPVYLHNLLDVARMPSHQAFDSSSFHQSILAVSEPSRMACACCWVSLLQVQGAG